MCYSQQGRIWGFLRETKLYKLPCTAMLGSACTHHGTGAAPVRPVIKSVRDYGNWSVGRHKDSSSSNGTVSFRAWMEERTEASESATRRAAQEPEQKVQKAARQHALNSHCAKLSQLERALLMKACFYSIRYVYQYQVA